MQKTRIRLPTKEGGATIAPIHDIPEFNCLPINAATAKAMNGDGEKRFAAGASDYQCKPVEAERLRSTLRLWLKR